MGQLELPASIARTFIIGLLGASCLGDVEDPRAPLRTIVAYWAAVVGPFRCIVHPTRLGALTVSKTMAQNPQARRPKAIMLLLSRSRCRSCIPAAHSFAYGIWFLGKEDACILAEYIDHESRSAPSM